MAGLTTTLLGLELLLQGAHDNVQHLVRVLLLAVDDPAVGPQRVQYQTWRVRIRVQVTVQVIEYGQHFEHASLQGDVGFLLHVGLEPEVERGAGCEGLQPRANMGFCTGRAGGGS